MPVRSVRKSAVSVVGSFPSLKLGRVVRFESTLERDLLYFLEFDPTVSSYEEQPFTIEATLEDGKVHQYTPDFKVIQNPLPLILEVKPFKFLDRENTIRQIKMGKKWAEEHSFDYQVITDNEIRSGAKLGNLKLLYRYRLLDKLPYDFMEQLKKLFADAPSNVSFGEAANLLMPSDPARCKPYLWSLLFHHYLETDLDQPLSDSSQITLSKKGE